MKRSDLGYVRYVVERAAKRGKSLHDVNLRWDDLCEVDLRGADLREADLWWANLYGANLCKADLRGANLHGADLRFANLHEADLRGANLDFSCWPLWCGSRDVILDDDQKDQLALHLYWVLGNDRPEKEHLRDAAKRAAAKRNVQL